MNSRTIRVSKREIFLRLSLVVLSVALIFAIGEIVSRLFFPDVELRYTSDPEALYRFEPNQVGFMRKGDGFLSPLIRINQLGLRGANLTDSNGRKILVLGDSFTFGSGVSDDETFAARLGQALDGNAVVVNGGQPGYGIFQMAATLRRLGERLRPNLVIVVLWQGDLTRQPPDIKAREDLERNGRIRRVLKTSVLLTQTGRGLERLLLRYGLNDWVIHVGDSSTPAGSDPKAVINAHLQGFQADTPRLLDMHREALQYGRGLFLVLWPKEDFAHVAEEGLADQLTESVRAFAHKQGIPFMSVQPALRGIAVDSLLIPNDWHPTTLAHCIVAQSIAAELTRLKLETFQSRPCGVTESAVRQRAQ